MLSDGREISIPFYDVIVHSYSDKEPEPALVTRRRLEVTPDRESPARLIRI